jgi:hypothetical protein
VFNLTQLLKNIRKRPNKKAGKKQPGPCDEDQLSVINPTPDSATNQSFNSSTVVTFSVCTECCSLSLRDGKCSKRIFLAADGLILCEALRFFNID